MPCKNCKQNKSYEELINSKEFKNGGEYKIAIIISILSLYGLYSLIKDIMEIFSK
jgi:hypothetical protein